MKHAEKRNYQLNKIKSCKPGKMELMMLPKPERMLQVQHAGYLVFFTSFAESLNCFLRHFLRALEYEK